MKKTIPFVLIILLLLSSCQRVTPKSELTSANGNSDIVTIEVPETAYPDDGEQSTLPFGTATGTTNIESGEVLGSQTINDTSATNTATSHTTSGTTAATEKENSVTTTFKNVISYTTTTMISTLFKTTRPSTTSTTKSTTKSTTRSTTRVTSSQTQKPVVTSSTSVTSAGKTTQPQSENELRGVWISCYDYTSAQGKTRSAYKQITDTMFKNIASAGLNTAYVHLVAFSDAFYKSDILPYSKYIAGTQGGSLPFDPFEVMLESAKKYGISVHGWINPFRVSFDTDTSLLSSDNPAKIILDGGNADGTVCVIKEGIYYNPSSPEAHKLIFAIVREIASKYDIDGIHIDDYFYPSTSSSVDKKQYNDYVENGGKLSLSEWRISNVSAFVSGLYSCVKSVNGSLTVSISPAADIKKNKTEEYADVETWLARPGYADVIIPQIYFGFDHNKYPFADMAAKWSNLRRDKSVKLACGLAAYKCGLDDQYAGESRSEWKENDDMLAKQLACLRKNKNYSGFVLFSYSDLTRKACTKEMTNLKNEL